MASRRADEMSNRKLGGKFYNYFKQTRKDQDSYFSPKKEEEVEQPQPPKVYKENIIDGPKKDEALLKLRMHRATFI